MDDDNLLPRRCTFWCSRHRGLALSSLVMGYPSFVIVLGPEIVRIIDGYFVHFVAPENLPPMSKHVVFVLDTSGSMAGKKMHQTKNAMKTILSDLREKDSMTIIEFDDTIQVWTDKNENQVFPATRINKEKAIEYVDGLIADQGTNINDALMKALSIIGQMKTQGKSETQFMIIFLTDGQVCFILGDSSGFYILSTIFLKIIT